MQLPANVRRIIEERADAVGFSELKRAAEAMSLAYRQGGAATRPEAYLVTRMPATYAATYSVLREVSGRLSSQITSILDVGAGPGAAALAAAAFFPGAAVTLLERDAAMAEAARWWLPNASAVIGDVTKLPDLPAHDLVIAAYSVGEFATAVTGPLWAAAKVALVVVEPGTPSGFARIRGMRRELLDAGAHMVAPCPGEGACPVTGDDWCHFAARVERSSMHRRLKQADLGYEDEKFSYLAVSRENGAAAEARIVQRPRHHPGLIEIATCTPAGLSEERVTKRDRDTFRRARHAKWGDAWGRVS